MDENYVTYDIETGTPLVYKCGKCSCCGSVINIDLTDFQDIIRDAVNASINDAISDLIPTTEPFDNLKNDLMDYINSAKQEILQKLEHMCENCNCNSGGDGGSSGGCGNCIDINGLCNANHTTTYEPIPTNSGDNSSTTDTDNYNIIDINQQNNGN